MMFGGQPSVRPSNCIPTPFPLCPGPIVYLSHCAPILLRTCPIVPWSYCVPVPLCPHLILYLSHCAPIPLCTCPIVPRSYCVPVPLLSLIHI